jgi:hypothetical protein
MRVTLSELQDKLGYLAKNVTTPIEVTNHGKVICYIVKELPELTSNFFNSSQQYQNMPSVMSLSASAAPQFRSVDPVHSHGVESTSPFHNHADEIGEIQITTNNGTASYKIIK